MDPYDELWLFWGSCCNSIMNNVNIFLLICVWYWIVTKNIMLYVMLCYVGLWAMHLRFKHVHHLCRQNFFGLIIGLLQGTEWRLFKVSKFFKASAHLADYRFQEQNLVARLPRREHYPPDADDKLCWVGLNYSLQPQPADCQTLDMGQRQHIISDICSVTDLFGNRFSTPTSVGHAICSQMIK